jgi:hypothetical protein
MAIKNSFRNKKGREKKRKRSHAAREKKQGL